MVPDDKRALAQHLNSRIRNYDAVGRTSPSRTPNTFGLFLSSVMVALGDEPVDLVVAGENAGVISVDVVSGMTWISASVEIGSQDSSESVEALIRSLKPVESITIAANAGVFNTEHFQPKWPGEVGYRVRLEDGSVLTVPMYRPDMERDGGMLVLDRLRKALS